MYQGRNFEVVCVLGYAKQGYFLCLGGPNCMKQGCWHHLGAGLCETGLWVLLGAGLHDMRLLALFQGSIILLSAEVGYVRWGCRK